MDVPLSIISNRESNLGVIPIIEVMGQIEKVLISGVAHHIGLINAHQQIFREDVDHLIEPDPLNDLVPSSSRNINIELVDIGSRIYWVLNVLDF